LSACGADDGAASDDDQDNHEATDDDTLDDDVADNDVDDDADDDLADDDTTVLHIELLAGGSPGYLGHSIGVAPDGTVVVAASKGALVVDFKNLQAKARAKKLSLKFSGATAAALPTLDVATISLAGAKILGFEGVLTGTTNYILSRLEQGLSFEEALKDARARGIAETDPSMDIDGWDTACKVLLLANASAGTEFVLDDLEVEGIRAVAAKDLAAARAEGNALKLLGRLYEEGGRFKADVKIQAVPSSHPLFRLTGTNKGIVFRTDTMGSIAVTDGKSDPRGTAAAVLKDLINIYRDR